VNVRAEFYSRLREIVGAPALDLTLPGDASVRDLVTELSARYPELCTFEGCMLFGVGVEFVDQQYTLRDGDVVAIMPPVQGG
jgi:molybdopterin converting factor small subunit